MLEHVLIGEVPTLCRNMTLGIAEVRFDPLAADPHQSGLGVNDFRRARRAAAIAGARNVVTIKNAKRVAHRLL